MDKEILQVLRATQTDKELLRKRGNIVKAKIQEINRFLTEGNRERAWVEFGKLGYNISVLCDIIDLMTDNLPEEEKSGR